MQWRNRLLDPFTIKAEITHAVYYDPISIVSELLVTTFVRFATNVKPDPLARLYSMNSLNCYYNVADFYDFFCFCCKDSRRQRETLSYTFRKMVFPQINNRLCVFN